LPLIFVLACVGAFAQANSNLTGIITDQTGAVVADATVTLTDPATGGVHSTVSSSTGLYSIAGLNPGDYDLKVTAKNFQTFAQTGIVINVSATFRVDVKLTVGAESQTITVSANALAVQADTNVISTLISSEQITEIATENRNFAALAALGLGVSSVLPDSNTPGSVGSNFVISINGLRQHHNIWLIDGGESSDRGGAGGMQIQPSQDAIAEFQVMSSNYPPDYGISSGATISLSLKSGTKKFHGTVWEEARNTAFEANKYFNKADGNNNPRPTVHYNIYGFNVGGPLYIPGAYNTSKQKTFFFWNEEWRKTVNLASSYNKTLPLADHPVSGQDLTYVAPAFASSTQLLVPNVTGGTSSYYYTHTLQGLGLTPNQCWDGSDKNADGTCTVAPKIPASLFDSNAILYINSGVLPDPNTDGGYNNASVSLPFKVRDDIIRVDHNFNDKWAILGHYIGDTEAETFGGPELGWCWCSYNTLTSLLSSPSWSAAIKLSGTITPNLLVEASINYDGNQIDISPSTTPISSYLPSEWSVQPVVAAYTVTRKIWPGVQGFGGPYSTAEDTATGPYHNHADDYEPKLDISYTVGQHAMKFGLSYNRYSKNQMLYGDQQGTYGFNGMTHDGIMDMLLGLPGSYSQYQSAPTRHYVNQTPSAYAMDNWHVTPRLTLQLGLRFDALPHAWEKNNYIGNFVQADYKYNALPIWNGNSSSINSSSPDLYTFNGIPSYINGMELAGQNHIPPGLVSNDYNTLQPRIGFSEDLFGNGKTVLRGGFGTFFERMQGNDIFDTATSAPFDPQLSLSNPYFSNPGQAWDTGTVISSDSLIFAGQQTSLAKNYKAPGVAMFSLGVQHEVAPSLIWVIQYVGNLAWHQNVGVNVNNMVPSIGLQNVGAPGTLKTLDPRCVSGGGNNYTVNGQPVSDANPALNPECNYGFQNDGGFNNFRQFPGHTSIFQNQNNTNGSYNGFQTGLRAQNKWGLSGEIDYTYSHEIDITSNDLTSSSANISNPWYFKYDKGSGTYDRRHILSINYIYKLPIFNKSAGLLKSIAGGWTISGTIIDESGTPASLSNSAPYNSVGLGGGYTIRPNAHAGKMAYTKTRAKWFDTTKFYAPTPVWAGGINLGFGNASKDSVVGPGRVNFTTSLYKSFQIYDTARFELRFESFNTFNHTEWNSLDAGMSCDSNAGSGLTATNTCVATGSYGKITSTWDPRSIELGGKFVF
jgi:hypothetical protein